MNAGHRGDPPRGEDGQSGKQQAKRYKGKCNVQDQNQRVGQRPVARPAAKPNGIEDRTGNQQHAGCDVVGKESPRGESGSGQRNRSDIELAE